MATKTPSSQALIQAQSTRALQDLLEVLREEDEVNAPSFINPLEATPNALGFPQQVFGGAKLGSVIFPPEASPGPTDTQRVIAGILPALQNIMERRKVSQRATAKKKKKIADAPDLSDLDERMAEIFGGNPFAS